MILGSIGSNESQDDNVTMGDVTPLRAFSFDPMIVWLQRKLFMSCSWHQHRPVILTARHNQPLRVRRMPCIAGLAQVYILPAERPHNSGDRLAHPLHNVFIPHILPPFGPTFLGFQPPIARHVRMVYCLSVNLQLTCSPVQALLPLE